MITPRRVTILERLVLVLGLVCIVVALAAVDLRLGLLVLGICLVASTVEVRR